MDASASRHLDPQPDPAPLLLYDYGGSPCARRVRISLFEKGLRWDTQTIDLSRLQQRSPDYLAINPNGLVPCLAHGSRVIWESNVITLYLDALFPEPRLYPEDSWQLAQVRLWQAAELALAKDYRPLMYQRLIGPVLRLKHTLDETLAIARRSTQNPADLEWERKVWSLEVLSPQEQQHRVERLYHWLDKLETALWGQTHLVGGRFTQAEISIYPRVAMFPYVGLNIDAKRYPGVRAWMRRLSRRPSFAATLSQQDRGIIRLARSGILPWLRRHVARETGSLSPVQRLGLHLLKRLIAQATVEPETTQAPALKQPASGAPPAVPQNTLNRRRAAALAAPSPVHLYDFPAAPECQRLHALLRALQMPYTRTFVDLRRLQHQTADFLRLNPYGELPVLEHAGHVLYDSAIIAEYLASLADDQQWLPQEPARLTQVRMWLAFDAAMHKEFRPLYWLRILRPQIDADRLDTAGLPLNLADSVPAEPRQWLRELLCGRMRFELPPEWACAQLYAKAQHLDEHLRRQRWLADGTKPTFADLALYTRLRVFPGLGVDLPLSRLPGLHDWLRRVAVLPLWTAPLGVP